MEDLVQKYYIATLRAYIPGTLESGHGLTLDEIFGVNVCQIVSYTDVMAL